MWKLSEDPYVQLVPRTKESIIIMFYIPHQYSQQLLCNVLKCKCTHRQFVIPPPPPPPDVRLVGAANCDVLFLAFALRALIITT